MRSLQINLPVVLLLLALVGTGCLTYRAHAKQSGSDVGPSEIRPESGQALYLREDSVLMKTQGTTLTAVGHHQLVPATWIRLLPAGTKVEAVEPSRVGREVTQTDALGERNPWYFVEVVDSPRDPQVGWFGWIHNSAFVESAPETPRERQTTELEGKAWVCPDGDRMNVNCEKSLPPGQLVEVYECKRFSVGVGTWNGQGHYLFGWVAQPRLASNPCE